MVFKDLMRETAFSIGTSSDLQWISNEISDELLGLKFNIIYYNFFLELQIGMKLGQDTCICT
jgi:hypothetical protein